MVELAKIEIQNLKSKIQNLKLLDIGTGSGIIPITLKKYFPNAEISAMDISEKALEIAKKNADFHQANIQFIVKGFEPNIALFSPTSDALIFYKKFAKDGEKYLNENGMIFLEINQKLGKETLELFSNYSESRLIKDLSGNDRFVFAKKSSNF